MFGLTTSWFYHQNPSRGYSKLWIHRYWWLLCLSDPGPNRCSFWLKKEAFEQMSYLMGGGYCWSRTSATSEQLPMRYQRLGALFIRFFWRIPYQRAKVLNRQSTLPSGIISINPLYHPLPSVTLSTNGDRLILSFSAFQSLKSQRPEGTASAPHTLRYKVDKSQYISYYSWRLRQV